jgi:hypothetical protein
MLLYVSTLNHPFLTTALPIMITLWITMTISNRRVDDIVKRLLAIEARLLAIETRLSALERKIEALEIKAWR